MPEKQLEGGKAQQPDLEVGLLVVVDAHAAVACLCSQVRHEGGFASGGWALHYHAKC